MAWDRLHDLTISKWTPYHCAKCLSLGWIISRYFLISWWRSVIYRKKSAMKRIQKTLRSKKLSFFIIIQHFTRYIFCVSWDCLKIKPTPIDFWVAKYALIAKCWGSVNKATGSAKINKKGFTLDKKGVLALKFYGWQSMIIAFLLSVSLKLENYRSQLIKNGLKFYYFSEK